MTYSDEEIEKMATEYAAPMEGVWKDRSPICREAFAGFIEGFKKAQELKRRETLVWLGYWRDKIPDEAVTQLQDIWEAKK